MAGRDEPPTLHSKRSLNLRFNIPISKTNRFWDSLAEGKFVALFGRAGRLRAVMAIGRPRQLMGFRPLLQAGSSWDAALAQAQARA